MGVFGASPVHSYTWETRPSPLGACDSHREPWSCGTAGVGRRSIHGHFTVQLSFHLLPPLKGMAPLPLFIFMGGVGGGEGMGVAVHPLGAALVGIEAKAQVGVERRFAA